MTLAFLPPYSPDLNPTEQVWRITRREVTHNTSFANAQILEDTLDPYFAIYRQLTKNCLPYVPLSIKINVVYYSLIPAHRRWFSPASGRSRAGQP